MSEGEWFSKESPSTAEALGSAVLATLATLRKAGPTSSTIELIGEDGRHIKFDIAIDIRAEADRLGKMTEVSNELATKYREALESIACMSKAEQTLVTHWLEISHEECAKVLAEDTKIARKALDGA